jgi:hypothetical protein
MFYNTDFLDTAQQHKATGLGILDDIVYGLQYKENERKIKLILNENRGMEGEAWSTIRNLL